MKIGDVIDLKNTNRQNSIIMITKIYDWFSFNKSDLFYYKESYDTFNDEDNLANEIAFSGINDCGETIDVTYEEMNDLLLDYDKYSNICIGHINYDKFLSRIDKIANRAESKEAQT